MATRLAVLDVTPGAAGEAMAIEAIARHALAEGATGLLIGLPLNMDGTEGKEAIRVRRFAGLVATRTGLSPLFCDERLTSEEAKVVARRNGWSSRSGKPIDDLAAALLLQGFLDESRAERTREALGTPEDSR